MANVVILGAGLGGLSTAALLASKGHRVKVFDGNSWLGGKSRRLEIAGSYVDTGPSLFTFGGVWQKFLETYDENLGEKVSKDLANLEFKPLSSLGTYFYQDEIVSLPVPKDHKWHQPWQRFVNEHLDLEPAITKLLTTDPAIFGDQSKELMSATWKLVSRYGITLTTEKYINNLSWMPDGLKEVIKIHTLNAGVAPNETIALYASMAAIMANNGVSIPRGGINEIPQAIASLAEHAGAEIHLGEAATALTEHRLTTDLGEYEFDFCVASVDSEVLARLLGKKPKTTTKYSCSGVAIYAVFSEPLKTTEMHSVVMPDNPDLMHKALGALLEPAQTMAFVNYYPQGEIYPGKFDSAAILLTAPANGKHYEFDSEWVQQQLKFIGEKMGEDLVSKISHFEILDPSYFAGWGSIGGALYGARKPFWRSGPFHSPGYKQSSWLYRVGAEVHPGGGIPAVLGGALIATGRMP